MLRALLLRKSANIPGTFERIGIVDPDPERNNPFNPHLFLTNYWKHPFTDNAMDFFKDAENKVIRIV